MNYLVYLHSLWFTHKKLFEIFEKQKDYKNFFENLSSEFLQKYWFNTEFIEKILSNLNKLNTKFLDEKLKNLEVKIIEYDNILYPKNLLQIANPPYFLYVRWELDSKDEYFWVVWSRKISNYAKKAWEFIIPDLTKYFTIVSGWAWWCDSLAHKLAVENNAKTIVVFGTWIDVIYPPANKNLFENVIKKSWALISIFPIWTLGSVYSFPVRNEVVSWMSKWILVLQAWEKSWTLITANLALDQWRDLFAVAWDIFLQDFVWCNELIKTSQAKLVSNSSDILSEYSYKVLADKNKILEFENDTQKDIFTLLKYNLNLWVDDFLQKTNYSYDEITLNLSMLELLGYIKKDLFWKYEIIF